MAIGFARATPIQRSRGHSTVQRLAYISRMRLVSARTGHCFDYSGRDRPLAGMTLLPAGCAEPEEGAVGLWEAVEAASKRTDAALGFELLLALPMPMEFPIEDSIAMAREFVRTILVDRHQLAATMAVHAPHGAMAASEQHDEVFGRTEDEDSFERAIAMAGANLHCHVLVSPRQLTPQGLAKRRYAALDPVKRGAKVHGRAWGRLWHYFQNGYFAAIDSPLRVTPNPPIPLTTVPLQAVRRWRKHQRRIDPDQGGRKLLVNAEREQENRAIVETIDGAMRCFDGPFTYGELETFYRRHLPAEIAAELTDATIGLGECVELFVPGSSTNWYTSLRHVQHELAAWGRALALSKRAICRRDVSGHVTHGFGTTSRAVLTALFGGADLSIVNASGPVQPLTADIARIAEISGLMPVTISTAAGHPLPKSVVRPVSDLRATMISRAAMIIDDADALTAAELSNVLAAGMAGNNKVILIRRQESEWPQLELLDLIAHHAPVVDWRSRAGEAAVRPVPFTVSRCPRTAIVYPTAHCPSGAAPPGWPRFGVDPEGEIVTSPADTASSIKLLATYPDDLDWKFAEHHRTSDETALALGLASWPGIDPAREDMELDPTWPEDDQFGREDAALASFDQKDRNDEWDDDPDFGLDDVDHDNDVANDFGWGEAEIDDYES